MRICKGTVLLRPWPGKGTFVAAQNKDFIREEQLRLAEEKL